LLEVAARFARRAYAKGAILFHRGSPGQRLYVVDSGRVRIFVLSDSGHEITVNMFGPGECFGVLALLDGYVRSAGAVALEPTVAYTLNRADFLGLLETQHRFTGQVLELVSQRLRHVTELFESLAFLDVHGRIASCLLEMAEHHGLTSEQGIILPVHLTQAELASCVVATRESVNKALGDFRDEGLIQQERHELIILDPAGLRRKVSY
jgi:CRP-like cAMP-binding protein